MGGVCSKRAGLSVEEAARQTPVRLRAVVTFYVPPLLFVQDDTAGIYVRSVVHENVATGQEVELTGLVPGTAYEYVVGSPARVLREVPADELLDA